MKKFLGNLGLLVMSCALSLAAVEAVSRVVLPVREYPVTDMAGHETHVVDDDVRLKRNGRFHHVSSEFDVVYTTTALGYRAPAVDGNPELVFLGDSFTFGYGVDDDQTFVALYCAERHVACANLGRIGTGTPMQVDILRNFLETEGWRPRHVRLMMFAMTGALMMGNDLTDNLSAARHDDEERTEQFVSGSANPVVRWISSARFRLRQLNISRITLIYAGPLLRKWLTPAADEAQVQEALRLTGVQLGRLHELAEQYGFTLDIMIIHPIQDVLRGTYVQTLAAIREIAPAGTEVRSTAPVLLSAPASYYYALDMHLNAHGHRAIADFLHSVDGMTARGQGGS